MKRVLSVLLCSFQILIGSPFPVWAQGNIRLVPGEFQILSILPIRLPNSRAYLLTLTGGGLSPSEVEVSLESCSTFTLDEKTVSYVELDYTCEFPEEAETGLYRLLVKRTNGEVIRDMKVRYVKPTLIIPLEIPLPSSEQESDQEERTTPEESETEEREIRETQEKVQEVDEANIITQVQSMEVTEVVRGDQLVEELKKQGVRNPRGKTIDPCGNRVNTRTPENHTPIQWDL